MAAAGLGSAANFTTAAMAAANGMYAAGLPGPPQPSGGGINNSSGKKCLN